MSDEVILIYYVSKERVDELYVICNNLYVTFKTYIFNTGWGTAKFIFKSTFHFISRISLRSDLEVKGHYRFIR